MNMDEPRLAGIPLKWLSLLTLVIQNSMLVIVMRYSRLSSTPGEPMYFASTAVVMSELTKFLFSLYIFIRNMATENKFSMERVKDELIGPQSGWLKMTVPAGLYVIQNNLQYLAVSNLDAATFQVTYQMKIITTALFSVWMLGKQLDKTKWISLVLLTVGIALVQLGPGGSSKKDLAASQQFIGLTAVVTACILSGLAGVWFEKVLKGSKTSIWARNVQLSFLSIIPAFFLGVLVKDGELVREHGFFYKYTGWTVAAIACQALGGLIVAMVVKYADNILKGFATSLSIILSSIASVFLFDFHISFMFLIGSIMVLYATQLYSKPAPPSKTYLLPKIDGSNTSKDSF